MRRFLSLVLLMSACGGPQAPTRPMSEFAVLRAQPSVYYLSCYGAVEFEVPSALAPIANPATRRQILQDAYGAAVKAGTVAAGGSETEWRWTQVCSDPGRYLSPSATPVTVRRTRKCLTAGTAFAVDEAGVFVTNAHVVLPPSAESFTDWDTVVVCLNPHLLEMCTALRSVLGADMPLALRPLFLDRFLPWYFSHCAFVSVEVTDVRLATRLPTRGLEWSASAYRDGIAALLTSGTPLPDLEPLPPDTVPATILATGVPYPGKDVAVVSAPGFAGALLCLALGDSDEVEPGTAIHALGFPGAAVIEGVDETEAIFRVISHDGILDQRLPLTSGWEPFHMTAAVSYGNSGGPVIDGDARVVAIAMAGNPKVAAQNLALPVNVVRERLTEAELTVATGPLTANWTRGFEEYRHGRFREAREAFVAVLKRRNQIPLTRIVGVSGTVPNDPYVQAMIARCTRALERDGDAGGAGGTWTAKAHAFWLGLRSLPLGAQILLAFLAVNALAWIYRKIAGRRA